MTPLALLTLAQSCSPAETVYGNGTGCLPMTGGNGPVGDALGIFGLSGPLALLALVIVGLLLLAGGLVMRRASAPILYQRPASNAAEAAARTRFYGPALAMMERKGQPASVTAVTAQTPMPKTAKLNPGTGQWEPARPLPLQGPLGRLEQRALDAGHVRLARIIGWIDETPLRWPFAGR